APGTHGPREEDDNFLFLPSLSLLYTGLGEDTQVFANIARGYTPAFARTAEDFPLEPETGINSQVGIRSELAGGWPLESDVFHNRVKDTIVQLPLTSNDMNIYLNTADSPSGGQAHAAPWAPRHAGSLTFGALAGNGFDASLSISHFGDFYTDPLNTRELTLADEDREPVGPGDELEIREPAVLGRVPSHTLLAATLRYAPSGQ